MATKTKTKPKISSQAVMEEIKTLAMLTGGVIIGSVSGKVIDKLLKVDNSAAGLNPIALARPIVLIGLGTAGNLFLKEQNLKHLATGVGAAGILSGVKVILKKDLLAGLSDFSFNGIGEAPEAIVYREPINLSVERYNPDLPSLSAAPMAVVSTIEPTQFSESVNPNQASESSQREDLSYIEII
ncbi:MAG: hypothetical protein CFE24_14945 [Flavobacterium sp. BFFFF2]|nr:MAG: hypothetical protein CFE24_14945 [Flavobacterium sp. BFFFF2]